MQFIVVENVYTTYTSQLLLTFTMVRRRRHISTSMLLAPQWLWAVGRPPTPKRKTSCQNWKITVTCTTATCMTATVMTQMDTIIHLRYIESLRCIQRPSFSFMLEMLLFWDPSPIFLTYPEYIHPKFQSSRLFTGLCMLFRMLYMGTVKTIYNSICMYHINCPPHACDE